MVRIHANRLARLGWPSGGAGGVSDIRQAVHLGAMPVADAMIAFKADPLLTFMTPGSTEDR